MIPTMTYFKTALSAPALHFKRLRLAEPVLCNGEIVVRRTFSAIESEIKVEGRHFLLYLPLKQEYQYNIEQLEITAQERSRGPLIENHILGEELTLYSSLGHKQHLDVILQEVPSGMMLKEAVNHYRADDLKAAIRKMKERMDAIGFRHNNLIPTNIVICDSGIARPLRYWYAKWELYSDNDISQLLDFIEQNCFNKSEEELSHLSVQDCEGEYRAKPTKHNGITRLCKGHRYGFVDSDGRQITPYIYSWASDFCEGRAIVAKNNKMGVINSEGRKVISVIYKHIEFDIETGIFTATNDRFRYLFDYDGDLIKRTVLAEENQNGVNVGV